MGSQSLTIAHGCSRVPRLVVTYITHIPYFQHHDFFDTTGSNGLNCNFMYKYLVKLSNLTSKILKIIINKKVLLVFHDMEVPHFHEFLLSLINIREFINHHLCFLSNPFRVVLPFTILIKLMWLNREACHGVVV